MSCDAEFKAGTLIIHLNENIIGQEMAKEFAATVREHLRATGPQVVVFDFRGYIEVDREFLLAVAPIAALLREANRKVFAVNLSSQADAIIRQHGLDPIIVPQNMDEIEAASEDEYEYEEIISEKPVFLDTTIVEPFINETMATLESQCSVEARPGEVYLEEPSAEPSPADIAAAIEMQGDAFRGILYICFEEKTFLGMMAGMLGKPCKRINTRLEEGLCEILFIIFGHAASAMSTAGHPLKKALPRILRGNDLQRRHASKFPCKVFVIPFESNVGDFQIEVLAWE